MVTGDFKDNFSTHTPKLPFFFLTIPEIKKQQKLW